MSSVRPSWLSRSCTADFSASTLRISGLVLAPRRTPPAVGTEAGVVVVVVVLAASTGGAVPVSSRRRAKPAPMSATAKTTATAKPVREEKKSRSRPGTDDDMGWRASSGGDPPEGTSARRELRVRWNDEY